jgi:hypothetical protein
MAMMRLAERKGVAMTAKALTDVTPETAVPTTTAQPLFVEYASDKPAKDCP